MEQVVFRPFLYGVKPCHGTQSLIDNLAFPGSSLPYFVLSLDRCFTFFLPFADSCTLANIENKHGFCNTLEEFFVQSRTDYQFFQTKNGRNIAPKQAQKSRHFFFVLAHNYFLNGAISGKFMHVYSPLFGAMFRPFLASI
ncbi:hypothetical protein [Porphyromonas loveana]|uniref:hypothetical protein n=1 Tax=Porphyromonas loveana TaxID=1884669 RepID=UPI00359F9982